MLPEPSPMVKVQATKAYGAKVVLSGETYAEAYEEAKRIQKKQKLVFIHGYEDPYVIAGQGTIGLEMMEQLPEAEAIIVPIGGGGLISGIAVAIKEQNPKIKVYGVQAAGAAGMADSFKKGRVVHWKTIHTMADGIAVKKTSPYIFGYIQKYVDDVVTVTDEEISSAIVQLLEKTKTVVEGAGATTLAALLSRKLKPKQKNIVCLLSGGNIDVTTLSHVIERGLVQEGRMMKLGVVLEDHPGALHQLTEIIAAQKANIMQVAHDRALLNLAYGKTRVFLTLETRGHEHIRAILKTLKKAGYKVE
jgi:threonine dehydratase